LWSGSQQVFKLYGEHGGGVIRTALNFFLGKELKDESAHAEPALHWRND
jgi:hypothetical protein